MPPKEAPLEPELEELLLLEPLLEPELEGADDP